MPEDLNWWTRVYLTDGNIDKLLSLSNSARLPVVWSELVIIETIWLTIILIILQIKYKQKPASSADTNVVLQ